MKEDIRAAFDEARATLDAFLAGGLEDVARFAEAATRTLTNGGKLLVCGNGGSMCDAMHFAEEWTGRFRETRAAQPAIAFSDPAQLTCIANDFGYDQVFARLVEALGRPGDLLVALSTSGNSTNVLQATRAAKERGVSTVGLSGMGGGALRDLVDVAIVVPRAKTSDRIQEIHIKILHAVIEAVEKRLIL